MFDEVFFYDDARVVIEPHSYTFLLILHASIYLFQQ
jgi:hypothetical protein